MPEKDLMALLADLKLLFRKHNVSNAGIKLLTEAWEQIPDENDPEVREERRINEMEMHRESKPRSSGGLHPTFENIFKKHGFK
jgi:hypothetical protein